MEKQLEWAMHLDKTYYMNVFGDRIPVAFTHGKGSYLYSTEGDKYLDLLGGIAVNSVGHSNPRLVKAISAQARKLIHCSSLYYVPNQGELARNLVERSFADRVFFCNSGAEANEAAIKLVRAYFSKKGTPRSKIITALKSFHGRTLAAVTATGQVKYNKDFAPLPGGFEYIPYNDIEALRNAVDADTGAVMLEVIQGEGGVLPATQEFLTAAAEICKASGALLVIDEVQTGVGRTGTFFGFEPFGITPDIVTLAKGLAGGVPIGCMLASEEVAAAFTPGDHGSTFGGNPLATAAALAVLEEIDKKNLMKNGSAVGSYLTKKLERLAVSTGAIKHVRGKGLLIGIELAGPNAVLLKKQLFERGFLVGSIGDSVIRIAPPLILNKREAALFVDALTAIFETKSV